jgi:hypothetical protein
MTRTELCRRLLANKLAAQIALDVAGGRSESEALLDMGEECERLEAEGADEATWVSYPELAAAYDRICPPDLDWRDVPPPY